MTEHVVDASSSKKARPDVGGVAPLALLGVAFLGTFPLFIATDPVPTTDVLALAPALYLVTVMAGLIASLIGFEILGWLFTRRNAEVTGWARATLVLLIVLPFAFAIGGLFGGPGLALGVGANGLGTSAALLWSTPKGEGRVWPYVAFLCASTALVVVGTIWMITALQAFVA